MPRKAARVVLALLTIAAIVVAAVTLARQWRAFRESGATLDLRWELILASSLIVSLAYAILVETWRRTVRSWGSEIAWPAAARIWFISNLGRYLPGKVWQIGAMGWMAQQEGVPAVAASGSAIVINLVNLLVGFGLVAATGAEFFDQRGLAIAMAVALLLGVAAAPRIIPWLGRAAGALLRRDLHVPSLPPRALWVAAVGCIAAWLLYGVAFQIFVAGVLGRAPGSTASYIAAFTGSYLLGYIFLFAPGGLGPREFSLVTALGRLGLASGGGAGVIAIASRLWLTVLEVLPGLTLLVLDTLRRRSPLAPDDRNV